MKVVQCPRCSIDVAWKPENKWRPFCTERCKLMDFGAWANEEYRVAGAEPPEGFDMVDLEPKQE